MFRIIICEEDKIEAKKTQKYLNKICKALDIKGEYHYFKTGEELLNYYSEDIRLVVLGINLGELTGMEVARRLRIIDPEVSIIFISVSTSYIQEGYEVNAKRYLIRPITEEEFIKQVKPCIEEVFEKKEEHIWIKSGYSAYKVPVHNILYAETYGRKVHIHTKKKIYDTHISLGQIEKMLNMNQFFRCHRGYLVNLQYVEAIEKESLIIKQQEIPVSRFKTKDVKQALLNMVAI